MVINLLRSINCRILAPFFISYVIYNKVTSCVDKKKIKSLDRLESKRAAKSDIRNTRTHDGVRCAATLTLK